MASISSRDIIKRLKADGWAEVARRGSHVQFKHPRKPGRVTVPHPKRDLPHGTAASVYRQAGLKPPWKR
jgi:predicted RNA binding protein YcfA (HicA-like mRNA interferase family)